MMRDATQFATVAATALVLAGLSGCETMGSTQPDPTEVKVSELEKRVDLVERRVDNESLVQMNSQIASLEEQVRTLRGQVEQLQFELESSRKRQRDLYMDLDSRIQSLQGGGPASPRAEAGATAPPAVAVVGVAATASEQDAYQAAFELLKQGRYDEAAGNFERFLAAYPDSNLADNAQYWFAETFYVSREFDKARSAFQVVVDEFPTSRKLPDALLKIGFCNFELEQWQDARVALTRVVNEYPDSTAARLANQRLQRMTSEGH